MYPHYLIDFNSIADKNEKEPPYFPNTENADINDLYLIKKDDATSEKNDASSLKRSFRYLIKKEDDNSIDKSVPISMQDRSYFGAERYFDQANRGYKQPRPSKRIWALDLDHLLALQGGARKNYFNQLMKNENMMRVTGKRK